MFKRSSKGQEGIGLVEVMMGVAISGGLALTVAKLMENTSQNTKQNEAKSENINLKGLVQNILSNTTACNYTFSPLITQSNLTTLSASPSNTVTVPSVKDKVNAVAYSTASTNINPLTITSLSLTNYNSATSTADLLIQSTFRRSSSQVQMVKPIRIPLNFNINNSVPASPVLIGCSTMAVGGEWMLGGNAGTNPASDYVGTSDNQPLIFRVNAQQSGRIDSVGQIFMGYQSGSANTTGIGNTAFGFRALPANTTGNYNTAIGNIALRDNTTGQSNVALGWYSLMQNTTGNHNLALGNGAVYQNTTGTANVGVGGNSLAYLSTGSNNIGVGWAGAYGVRTGSNNIGIGQNTLNAMVDGSNNIGIGQFALQGGAGPHAITTASENTSVGSWSLQNSSEGSYNVALGSNAGAYNRSGNYNTFVGYRTGPWAAQMSGSRNIFIGAYAGNSSAGSNTTNVTTASDKLYINNGVSNVPLVEGSFSSAGRFIKIEGNLYNNGNTVNNANRNNIAWGTGNTINTGASGTSLFGHNNVSTGSANYAMGVGNQLSGWLTHGFGQDNNVSGNASIALGWNNNITSQRSFVMGHASSASADYSWVFGIDSSATHSGAMVFSDYGSSGAQSWGSDTFTSRFAGGYRMYTSYSGTTNGVYMNNNANSWSSLSDRNSKDNIRAIDLEEHLRKIAKLPVYHWEYIGQDIPHMGPMAQDFYYIFRQGDGDDKGITTQDMEGVTIVAVKALEERTRKLAAENSELKKDNEDLKKRLERLEAIILKNE